MSEENKTQEQPQEQGLKDLLSDEFKETPELQNFKDVNALAKSFVEASKTLSSRFSAVTEEDNLDDIVKKTKLFNNLQKDYKYSQSEIDHKDSEKLSGIFNKYGVNPKVAPRVLKDVLTVINETDESVKGAKTKIWKDDAAKVWKDVNNKDERIGKALSGMKMTREELEASLGDYRENPTIHKLLFLASQDGSNPPPALTTTNAGGQGEVSVAPQEAADQLAAILNDPALYDPKALNYGVLNREADKLTKVVREAQKKGLNVDTSKIQKSII